MVDSLNQFQEIKLGGKMFPVNIYSGWVGCGGVHGVQVLCVGVENVHTRVRVIQESGHGSLQCLYTLHFSLLYNT